MALKPLFIQNSKCHIFALNILFTLVFYGFLECYFVSVYYSGLSHMVQII